MIKEIKLEEKYENGKRVSREFVIEQEISGYGGYTRSNWLTISDIEVEQLKVLISGIKTESV